MVWFIDLSPSLLVFMGLSLLGTAAVILSTGVVGIWFGLECNFFGFVPLLNGQTSEESEGGMKYFIIQGLGSALIFIGICFMLMEYWWSGREWLVFLPGFLFLTGLMVKVGLFPFHFWFPSIMGGSSWFNCFMLSTWQKLGVFFVFSGVSVGVSFSLMILLSAVMTSVIGGVGGVGQVYFRSIMAYSSLVHSGWMVVISFMSDIALFFYYLIYMVIVFFVFRMLSYFQTNSFGGLSFSGFEGSNLTWAWVFVSLLSLGGLPPFLGSAIKLLGIVIAFTTMKMILLVLVVSSVVGLFYYLSIVFSISLSFSGVPSGMKVDNSLSFNLIKNSFLSLSLNSVVGIALFMMVGSLFL